MDDQLLFPLLPSVAVVGAPLRAKRGAKLDMVNDWQSLGPDDNVVLLGNNYAVCTNGVRTGKIDPTKFSLDCSQELGRSILTSAILKSRAKFPDLGIASYADAALYYQFYAPAIELWSVPGFKLLTIFDYIDTQDNVRLPDGTRRVSAVALVLLGHYVLNNVDGPKTRVDLVTRCGACGQPHQ